MGLGNWLIIWRRRGRGWDFEGWKLSMSVSLLIILVLPWSSTIPFVSPYERVCLGPFTTFKLFFHESSISSSDLCYINEIGPRFHEVFAVNYLFTITSGGIFS